MADLGKNFAILPIDQLISAPILAVAQGQAELCRVYLDNPAAAGGGHGKTDQYFCVRC